MFAPSDEEIDEDLLLAESPLIAGLLPPGAPLPEHAMVTFPRPDPLRLMAVLCPRSVDPFLAKPGMGADSEVAIAAEGCAQCPQSPLHLTVKPLQVRMNKKSAQHDQQDSLRPVNEWLHKSCPHPQPHKLNATWTAASQPIFPARTAENRLQLVVGRWKHVRALTPCMGRRACRDLVEKLSLLQRGSEEDMGLDGQNMWGNSYYDNVQERCISTRSVRRAASNTCCRRYLSPTAPARQRRASPRRRHPEGRCPSGPIRLRALQAQHGPRRAPVRRKPRRVTGVVLQKLPVSAAPPHPQAPLPTRPLPAPPHTPPPLALPRRAERPHPPRGRAGSRTRDSEEEEEEEGRRGEPGSVYEERLKGVGEPETRWRAAYGASRERERVAQIRRETSGGRDSPSSRGPGSVRGSQAGTPRESSKSGRISSGVSREASLLRCVPRPAGPRRARWTSGRRRAAAPPPY